MMYWQISATIGGETSPVYAPAFSQCMFWAPIPMSVPSSKADTASKAVKGGQSTFSTPLIACKPGTISETICLASVTVLYIFQLPATTGVRMVTPYPVGQLNLEG